MRATDYDALGQLLTAASTWRNTAKQANAELNELTVKMPNGGGVRLVWVEVINATTDPETGAITNETVWSGWDVQTTTA